MGILEAGFASHIERAELGITCDRERLIHGHVALEVRSISHDQRARVHSARRGDSASIHTSSFQLAFRSHIAVAIDSHLFFDNGFAFGIITSDTASAVIGILQLVIQLCQILRNRLIFFYILGLVVINATDFFIDLCIRRFSIRYFLL